MAYNIKELLSLPDEEKIAIADLLYSSIADDDKSTTPWYDDEAFVRELEQRSQSLREGKGYTLDQVKDLMEAHKANYRNK